jgi:hypothetical protein
MATKRKRGEDRVIVGSANALGLLLSSAIANNHTAEIALLHIMEEYDFGLNLLQQVLLRLSILLRLSELNWNLLDSDPFFRGSHKRQFF